MLDGAGVKLTVPPATTIGVAIDKVFVSAWVDFNVQVDTPPEVVAEQALYTFVLPLSVALKVGTIPEIPAFEKSFKVMVTVEVATPSASTDPVPTMVELTGDAETVNVTEPPLNVKGAVTDKVFTSALPDFNVQVDTPDEFELEQTP